MSSTLIGLVYLSFATQALLERQQLPVQRDASQEFLDGAGDRLAALVQPHNLMVAFHPYLIYRAGSDPFDKDRVWRSWPAGSIEPGDLVVWDAQFGPNEGATPLNRLLEDARLELLEVLVPKERWEVLGGLPMEVFIFTVGKGKRSKEEQHLFRSTAAEDLSLVHRFDTIQCPSVNAGWCFGSNEFPFEIELPPLDHERLLYAEVIITGTFDWLGDPQENVELILAEDSPQGQLGYWSNRMATGPFNLTMRLPPRSGEVRRKLYIWNLSRTGFMLGDMQVRLVLDRRSGG